MKTLRVFIALALENNLVFAVEVLMVSGWMIKVYYFVNSKNSSYDNPASEIISISNPRFISSCFGTGTAMLSFTSIM